MWKRMAWLMLVTILPVCFVWALLGGGGGQTAAAAPTDPPFIIINEIHADPADDITGDANGDGIRSADDDEFVELVNVGNDVLDLSGWTLHDVASPTNPRHTFWSGTVLPPGCAVIVFGGGNPTGAFGGSIVQTTTSLSLNNTNETVTLKDLTGTAVISYTYGSEGGDNQSLTRSPDLTGPNPLIKHTIAAGSSTSLFSPGTRVDGAPFASCELPPMADLSVSKTGPPIAAPGENVVYQLRVQNLGDLTAVQTILTDTLPTGLTYIAHSGGYPLTQPDAHTLVWQLGDLPAAADWQFSLTTTLDTAVSGVFTNTIQAATATSETTQSNNQTTAVTVISRRDVLIDAIYYDAYEGLLDEAIALRNVSAQPIDVGGWQISDGAATAVLPANTFIPAQTAIWLSNDALAFQRQFGHAPDLARVTGGLPIPALIGAWPGYANDGDEVLLRNAAGVWVDVLVYEAGNIGQPGWLGPAVQPYAGGGLAVAGQILYRMRDQLTGQPTPDTDTAADWAQSTTDVINGRKVRYPGWDLDAFFFTTRVTETAVITLAIAPDNAYHAIVSQIDHAQNSIHAAALTIESIAISDALVRAANRGVAVSLLLEGGPPGGLSDQEKYICQQIEQASGACWFMINDAANKINDRYSYLHAKFMLLDDEWVIISSQNFSPDSLPDDDKSDGTWGRRGVVLLTNAPTVVQHVQLLHDYDFDPTHHADVFRWLPTPDWLPPPNFVPITATGGITYPVFYPAPSVFTGVFPLEIVQSPENSLRDVDGLLGLVNRAGTGDVVWVQQLYERPFWGSAATGSPTTDPNPRLEAYIAAARRGADVRLLLDSFFDAPSSPTSNRATCDYVNNLALLERLRLDCALNNPTGLGIHNKMVLVRLNGRGYVHVGSLNGSEQSHKDNRELALQVQSDAMFALLAEMFIHDWPHQLYLPIVLNNFIGPAAHPLISEVLYDPPGPDTTEFIELVNPTPLIWDLSHYSISDAVNRTDFEDTRRFPAGTFLLPGRVLVVALSAADFFAEYGFYPDFEILNTSALTPDLIDDLSWGDPATFLQLGNQGDEVILRNVQDQVVDVLTYGTGNYPGAVGCPLVSLLNASLERLPYWRDTDNCTLDFREWPFPNPGSLP
ncbi:MAG: lamin tail domain-containing protein [Chloroflexi bacterium]|nr:lamin tail domain-containing protein [Chloroflexota bacterium]